MNRYELAGRPLRVTGAAGGIGRAVARAVTRTAAVYSGKSTVA